MGFMKEARSGEFLGCCCDGQQVNVPGSSQINTGQNLLLAIDLSLPESYQAGGGGRARSWLAAQWAMSGKG